MFGPGLNRPADRNTSWTLRKAELWVPMAPLPLGRIHKAVAQKHGANMALANGTNDEHLRLALAL